MNTERPTVRAIVPLYRCTLFLLYLCSAATAAAASGTPTAALDPEPAISPGREVRLTAPKTGKTFLLYVPTDYTDARPFPVIFSYHGYRGTATTALFRQVTKGRGFLIVGMNYATDRYYQKLRPTDTAPEIDLFTETLAIISERLNVAKDSVFMGGYSQGGYSTTVLGEQLLDRLAGRIVLGAGRRDVDMNPPPAELIRGHPVFYGAGVLDDPHYRRAERAAQLYADWGADVTFEGWANETHSLSRNWITKTEMLDWLRTYGPQKQVETGYEQAETAERTGHLGTAFTTYTEISDILPDTARCQAAKTAAERIGTEAERRFTQITTDAEEKPYATTQQALATFQQRYAGSRFAERAAALQSELLNAKADELEARARTAETEQNSARALQLYRLYLKHFKTAKRYRTVEKYVKHLKNSTQTQ